jgi:hypothetical protein
VLLGQTFKGKSKKRKSRQRCLIKHDLDQPAEAESPDRAPISGGINNRIAASRTVK